MNKKIVWLFLLSISLCPMLSSIGHHSFIHKLKRKKKISFEQALAQLYLQKPHLLKPQQPLEAPTTQNRHILWKKIIDHSVNALPLLYFCYGSYCNYTNYRKSKLQFQESYLHQAILSNFPSLLVNTPGHVSLFLQETELLLQAYLLKLLLKMIIFCFG